MEDDKILGLYNQLKNDGYELDDEETFREGLKTDQSYRQLIYNTQKNDGYNMNGDFNEWEGRLMGYLKDDDNGKPVDLSAATAGAQIDADIIPIQTKNSNTAQSGSNQQKPFTQQEYENLSTVAQDVAKGVGVAPKFDTQGTAEKIKEQLGGTKEKTQFVPEASNVVMATPTADALKKYPFLKADEAVPFNRETGEPFYTWVDENGKPLSQRDIDIRTAKQEITGEREYMQKAPAAPELPDVNANAVKLDGSITDFVDNQMRAKYGDNYLNELFKTSDGREVSGTDYLTELSQGLYDGLIKDVNNARMQYIDADDDQKNQIVNALADKYKGLVSRDTIESNMTDEQSQAEAKDARRRKERQQLDEAYNNAYSERAAVMGENMAKAQEDYNNASWLDKLFGGSPVQRAYWMNQNDDRIKIADTQINLVLDAKRVLDTGKAYDDGESWSGRFVRGMRDAMKDTGLYDGGIEEMNDLRNVKFALDAYESGNATAEQKDLLDTYALLQTVTGENSDALGRMYSAGQTTVQAIPFMLQMYINPIGSLGQSTAKAATQFALKQFGRSMMSKYMKRLLATSFKAGGRITGDMLAASLPAMTFGAPAIGADMYDRLIGNVKGVTDNEGNIEYSSREGQEKSKATAIAKAIGSNYFEYQSEMVGEYFRPLTNILSAGIGKATEKMGLGQINDLIANLSNKNFYRSFSDFAKRTQWQGTIGEYLEEVVNNAENALFIGDMDFSTGPNGVFNKDVNIDTFLGVAAMTGFMSSLKTADYIRTRGRIKDNLDNAYNNGLSLFGVDEWEKISNELDNIDENNAAKTVKRLVNSVDDNDMKQAIANYAAASAMNHGFNIGDLKNNIEEASDNIVNGKVPRSAIPGFDALSSDEQQNVHDDGMIHSAILYPITENGGNAEQVFIVKGNVALNNDGSVDIKNSSDAIYYRGSDGQIHQVAPDKILAADVPVSVEDYIASKNNTSSNVSQEPSQQAVQYSVGDEVNIDVNGQSMHGEVAGTTEDGNYIVSYENEDGTMSSVRMSPEELAGYNQATDASQQMPEVPTSTNAPQSIEQPVEAQQPAQAVEPVQPVESNTEQVQPANAEGTAQVQQEQSAQQSIPTDEEGNPLYYNAPIEATINDLYDGSLNDEEIQGFIDANIQDAQKKYDSIQKKAPKIGTNKAKYLEQKREWQTNADEAKRILDYWQSVDNYRKEQTHTTDADIQSAQAELSGDNARAEFDEYNDNGGVNNAVSVASDFIRGAKITPGSFKAETGYGTSEQQKFVGMIAKEENGGKTIDRLAEELVSYDNSELNGVTYRGDTSLAKDAILEALQAAGTRGELAQNNTAEREKYVEARMADLDAQYMEAYGMTYDEYLSYEEQIMPTIWRDYNNYDEVAFNNMYAEEIQQLLNTRENGNTTGEKQTDDRGNQVLSEQQSIEQPGSAGSTEPGTEIQTGVQSNNENAAPQEEAQQTVAQKIADAEAQTDTNPTEAQKEAGNYKKGHVKIDGYDVTIENPKGSVRSGVDRNGKQWEQTMNNTYGYIRGTEGVDGDHIDIFLSDNPTEGNVYVVDQVNPDGSFDEHKVMYGFNSADEARNAYLSNYEEGWQGLGTITEVSKGEFKKWVESSHRKTKPFVEYRSVNKDGAQNEGNTLANEAHELFSDIIAQSTHNVEINDSGISETDNTLYAPIKVDGKDTSLSLYQEEPAHSSEEPVVGVSFYRDGMTYQEAADLSDAYNQYVGERVCADGSDELAINFGSIDEAVRFEEWLNDNGGVRFREAEDDSTHKQRQLEIINDTNPMLDDYHTGIRSEDDIKTMREAIEEARSEAEKYGDETWSAYPDITNEMLDEALRSGKITVYSSKPIVNGNFVTPSRMQASDYAGGGRIYSKTVNIDDVAWINTDEGQYANTDNDANGNIRFRFIGEQGAARLDAAEEATTRLDNLSVAREMENAGKDAKTIKAATGWERGADNQWRYETPDFKFKENPVVADFDGYSLTTLESLINDEELFKAYPQLSDMLVQYQKLPPGMLGAYSSKTSTFPAMITLDEDFMKKKENPEWRKKVESMENEPVVKAWIDAMDKEPFDMQAYEKAEKDFKASPLWDEYNNLLKGQGDTPRYIPGFSGEQALAHEIQHAIQDIEGFSSGTNTKNKQYKESAGEVEARNVEKRFNMTPEQRRQSLASETEDVAREDQIFLEKSLDANYSIGDTKTISGGRQITFTRANPTTTFNSLKKRLDKEGIDYKWEQASTGSRYINYERGGVNYEIRSANHTKGEYGSYDEEEDGINILTDNNKIYDVEIDLSRNDMRIDDIYQLMDEVDKFNNSNINLDEYEQRLMPPSAALKGDYPIIYNAIDNSIINSSSWLGKKRQLLDEYNNYLNENTPDMMPFVASNGVTMSVDDNGENVFTKDGEAVTKRHAQNVAKLEREKSIRNYVRDNLLKYDDWLNGAHPEIYNEKYNSIIPAINETAEKLNLNVRIVNSPDEITNAGVKRAVESGRKIKGWFDTDTNEVVVYMPNTDNVDDAIRTVLHEGVAHYGLRQLVGEENFNTFLDNIYNNVSDEIKSKIDDIARKNKLSTQVATEEYLAGLAETTNFEEVKNSGVWDKIKDFFMDLLTKAGVRLDNALSDNELRYILWRSYDNLQNPTRDVINTVRDITKQRDLNVGNYAVQNSSEKVADNDDIRYREVDDELPSQSRNKFRELYEEGIKGRIATLIRAYFDRMQPMKRLQEAIEKETSQPIQPEENVYLQENRAMSIANRKYEIWERSHMEPVREAVVKLMKDIRKGNFLSDVLKRTNTKRNAYNAVVQYMKTKHGLENNEYRRNEAAMEARKPFEDEIAAVQKSVKDNKMTEADAEKNIKQLKEQADKAEAESRKSTKDKDYSGLQGIYGKDFEQKAKDYVGAFEESFKTDDFWKTWNGATKAILEEEYKSGLLSKELYDKIRGMYKYYIPLKGWAENRAEDVYTYYTTGSGDGGRMQRRKGRTSESDDPLVTLEQDADRQFNAAARNNVKRALYNLATTHKSDLLTVRRQWYQNMGTKENPDWQRVDAEIPENATPEEMEKIVSDFEKNMRELAKNGTAMRQKRPMILPYHATKRMEKEHTVRVMVNGKEYAIYVNGNPAAAQAVNGTSTPKDADNKFLENFVLRPLRWFNRTRAALLTAWNFNFIPSNLARDAQYSIQNMKAKEPATYVMRYVKNLSGGMAKMTSARLFYKDKKGTLDMNDPTERLFKEFLDNGGETGYSKTMTLEQRRRSNMSAINKLSGIDWTKGARLFFDTLAYANRSIETIVRFAAYKTSRESGRSIVQSINDAKEASVNFDKHGSGEYGNKEWRLLYIFANVKFQSMRRMLENATGHPVRFTLAQAERFALGFAVPMLAKFILDSFGDDDEKDAYDALPEWMRQSGLTIPISPIVPGVPKRTFLYLPFGPEDKVWYALGEMSYHEFNSDEPNENMAKEFASLVADLLPVDVKGYGGNMVVNLAPTAVQDIVALEQNVNYWGQPIYRETMPYNENEPGQNLAFAGTPEWFVKRAEDINRLTGGNDYSKGAFSPKPEQIEYIINQTGGGVTRVVSQIMGLVERAGEDGNKDIPALKNTPVLSSFVKQAEEKEGGKGFDREAYYKYINEYEKAIHDLKAYTKGMKKGDDEASRLAEELKKSPAGERMDTIRNNIGKIRARDKAIRKLNEIEKPTPKQEMQLEELKKESNEMKNELVDKLDDITEKRGE